MTLKLTRKQSTKVRKLARRTCCNCVGGNCLLLDDGEHCCVQHIFQYGIYCNYFSKRYCPPKRNFMEEIRNNPTKVA